MRRRIARVRAPRSGFAGFRFPPEVISARWVLRHGAILPGVADVLSSIICRIRKSAGSIPPVIASDHHEKV
jgi:hypothetical protein